MVVRDLVHELGGPTEVSREVGASIRQVSMWSSRNKISGAYLVAVWRLAVKCGVDWTPPGAEGLSLSEIGHGRPKPAPQLGLSGEALQSAGAGGVA